MIKYLHHNDIDRAEWDRVVNNSPLGLPYCYSWYLDIVSPGWEALVEDDYIAVMPLPLKRKYGVSYLIEPCWVQQLGVISSLPVTENKVCEFISHIPYFFYDFNLNELNSFCRHDAYVNTKLKSVHPVFNINMHLPIFADISTLRGNYSKNTRRNIRHAQKAHLFVKAISADEMVMLWTSENQDKSQLHHTSLLPLILAAQSAGMASVLGVFEADSLVAALFGLKTSRRFIYLAPVSSARGKELRAMFLLLDHIVETLSVEKLSLVSQKNKEEESFVLDFEGSMIPGVAQFYKGFGAQSHEYVCIHKHRNARFFGVLHRFISYVKKL